MKMIKKRFREQARDKHLNLYGEEKKKRESMGGIDIAICVKIKNKD